MRKNNSELEGWYLVRAYHKDAEPFAVLTDVLRENMAEICEKVAPVRTPGLAEDYDYMEERREVENWLRESAKAGGVDIRKENPVYFALTRDPEAFASYMQKPMPGYPQRADREVIVIPASEADLSACSFTYDDSFGSHSAISGEDQGVSRHALHGIVFNAKQMTEALKIHGEPGSPRYIEVQMWDKPSIAAMPVAKVLQPVRSKPPTI